MTHRLVFVLLILWACTAAAHAAPGAYLGASVGQSGIADERALMMDFDESATAFKVFGGFHGKFLGLEAGYLDFGAPEGDIGAGSTRR